MNLRKKTVLGLVVLLSLAMTSCGSFRRAGKDLGITLTSPLVILYGAGTDATQTSQEIREGVQGGIVSEVISLPFAFVWHAVEHTFKCAIHAVDFFLLPVYGVAELHPYGPEVEPLDYYTGTFFDESPEADADTSGIDAESGEADSR